MNRSDIKEIYERRNYLQKVYNISEKLETLLSLRLVFIEEYPTCSILNGKLTRLYKAMSEQWRMEESNVKDRETYQVLRIERQTHKIKQDILLRRIIKGRTNS